MSKQKFELDHNDEQEIAALLVGRSVRKVDYDLLLLDDGSEMKVVPNEGGCICGAGDYSLEFLGESPNVITAADVLVESEDEYGAMTYRIFVYSEGVGSDLARIVGDDGSGYYGTGFSIEVTRPAVQS